jgi:hypothetical protein
LSTAPQDGGGFEDLPPLDDEWIKGAAKREESAQQRADRLRRIAAEHERIQRQMEADRRTAATQHKRDQWRPWVIGLAIIAALALVFIIL